MNTHANPSVLGNGTGDGKDSDQLTISEIGSLDWQSIPVLILLGCNAGHYDYTYSNVAYAFSKRISGVVVASDGTVYPGLLNSVGDAATFTSKADDDFDEYCKTNIRTNKGWVRYKQNLKTGSVAIYYYSSDSKTLKINWIMADLKSRNYYK